MDYGRRSIPIDVELSRDLGYAAVIHLHHGLPSALLTIQGGECRPIPFADVLDQGSGKGLVLLLLLFMAGLLALVVWGSYALLHWGWQHLRA